jgi:hypothetical protein
VEVSECSCADERAQSRGTTHGARVTLLQLRWCQERRGVVSGAGGQGEGGRGSVARTRRMEGAPDDRHDADAVESLAGQVNRGG